MSGQTGELVQQTKWAVERFLRVSVSLSVHGNVRPVSSLQKLDWGSAKTLSGAIRSALYTCGKQHFRFLCEQDLCVVPCLAKISVCSNAGAKALKVIRSQGIYVNQIQRGVVFPPVVLAEWRLLERCGQCSYPLGTLYNLDGMHRLCSAFLAGKTEIDVLVVLLREHLVEYMATDVTTRLRQSAQQVGWFPHYQQIKEVGFSAGRAQRPRYRTVYDFRCVEGSTVADFGCNLGQASLEAAMAGASAVYGFDCMSTCVEVARGMQQALGLPLRFEVLDFNQEGWQQRLLSIVSEWDYLFFLAVYRTKEIQNRDEVFRFLVSRTKKAVFFEGHADPAIDTPAFYERVFTPYAFKDVQFLGLSDKRPAYKLSIT
jgi:hypothetical protein